MFLSSERSTAVDTFECRGQILKKRAKVSVFADIGNALEMHNGRNKLNDPPKFRNLTLNSDQLSSDANSERMLSRHWRVDHNAHAYNILPDSGRIALNMSDVIPSKIKDMCFLVVFGGFSGGTLLL